jgi:hypothetical protein
MGRSALAVTGIGSLLSGYGLYELIKEGNHHEALFWLFLGVGLLFLAQVGAVQRALKEREAARASASVTGIGVGGDISGGVISGNVTQVGLVAPRRSRSRRCHLSEDQQRQLAERGRQIADRLNDFSAERRRMASPLRFAPRGASQEEWHLRWEQESDEHDRHAKETHAKYHRWHVGEMAAWLDEAREAGFDDVPNELRAIAYSNLSGPTPIEDVARGLYVLAGRIERNKPRWWTRYTAGSIASAAAPKAARTASSVTIAEHTH